MLLTQKADEVCMDYIVYRKETCKIIEKEDGYYRLVPVNDTSIKYKVPVDSNFLKKVITKEEIDRLLLEIPEINTIDLGEKQIEQEYKELMKSGTHEDLVKIIKTSYLRNQIRILNNKRISEIDDEYFRRAEKYLYEEIGIVLNLSFENTKEYIINKLKKAN
jgi:transcriptional regulator, carD family